MMLLNKSFLRSGGSTMIVLSAIVLLAFSQSALPSQAFTANTLTRRPNEPLFGTKAPSKFRINHLCVGRNGRSFEQSDRFNYETDFADRIGGTPNPDSWAQPVNGIPRRRRGIPYRTAIANAKAASVASDTSGTNTNDETAFTDSRAGSSPETNRLRRPVNVAANYRQVQLSTRNSEKKSTVNGMYNYETDFADRIGSSPDVDSWAQPVNGRFHNRQYRRGVPAVQVSPPVPVPKKRNNPVNAVNTIQQKPQSTSPGVAAKKSTVNGMYNYETDFADRIGSSPDVDAWSRPARNGMKIRRNK